MDTIRFTLNGRLTRLSVDGERPLLWVLRVDLGLTGPKYGCGESQCGACSVLLNDKVIRACVIPVRQVDGQDVVTIEGLGRDGHLHPLQKAFMSHEALQCGFCIPGMILNAYSLLHRNPNPNENDIIKALDHNLCRCGAHQRIIAAVQSAAQDVRRGVLYAAR